MTARQPVRMPPAAGSSTLCQTAKRRTAEAAAIFEAYVDAVHPLVAGMVRSGQSHEEAAAALNRRGLPCWGRDRWTPALVRMVLRQRP
jgi:hypothetical protein